jgi:hypothetical protein
MVEKHHFLAGSSKLLSLEGLRRLSIEKKVLTNYPVPSLQALQFVGKNFVMIHKVEGEKRLY